MIILDNPLRGRRSIESLLYSRLSLSFTAGNDRILVLKARVPFMYSEKTRSRPLPLCDPARTQALVQPLETLTGIH